MVEFGRSAAARPAGWRREDLLLSRGDKGKHLGHTQKAPCMPACMHTCSLTHHPSISKEASRIIRLCGSRAHQPVKVGRWHSSRRTPEGPRAADNHMTASQRAPSPLAGLSQRDSSTAPVLPMSSDGRGWGPLRCASPSGLRQRRSYPRRASFVRCVPCHVAPVSPGQVGNRKIRRCGGMPASPSGMARLFFGELGGAGGA